MPLAAPAGHTESPAVNSRSPLVSVVIPCHNYGHFLSQSVTSALSQSYSNTEVLVIDDASSDNTPEVAAQFGSAIRYLRGKWGGPSGSRNFGIRQAAGQYIALLDADDRWLPHKLTAQMDVFRRNPDTGLVHGGWRQFRSEDDATLMTFTPPELVEVHEIIGSCPIGCSTTVFPKALFNAVGGFDETLRGPEDWDLWIRLAERAPVRSIPDLVGEYRVHGKSLSRQHERQLRDSTRVLRKHRRLHPQCRECADAFKTATRRIKNMYYAQACAEAADLWEQGRRIAAVGLRSRALWNYPAAVSRPVRKVGVWLGMTRAATAPVA